MRLQTSPAAAGLPAPLVRVDDLKKHFPVTRGLFIQRVTGLVRAVDGISFTIHRGDTLGLVGESGCGKTTAGRTLLGLYRPTCGVCQCGWSGYSDRRAATS